jgi:hypothetical protein
MQVDTWHSTKLLFIGRNFCEKIGHFLILLYRITIDDQLKNLAGKFNQKTFEREDYLILVRSCNQIELTSVIQQADNPAGDISRNKILFYIAE